MSSMVMDGIARSRSTDPVTSVDAGRSADLAGSQEAVLLCLQMIGPRADFEIAKFFSASDYTYSEQRLRSARSELVEAGLVEFSGIYRLTPSGRKARVWQAAA